MSKAKRGERFAPLVSMAAARLRTRKEELEHDRGRKLTVRELEAQTGIDFGSVSEILNGKQPQMSAAAFFALCEALKTDPMKMWYGDRRRPVTEATPPPPESVERPSSRSPPAPPSRRGR